MQLSVWGWVRAKVKECVLAGFGDALAELESGEPEGSGEAARGLVQRLQLALPEPEEVKGVGRKR